MLFVLLTGALGLPSTKMWDWMDPLQGHLPSCSFWSSSVLQFSLWHLIILIFYFFFKATLENVLQMCRANSAGEKPLRQDFALPLQGRSPVDFRASGLFLPLCCQSCPQDVPSRMPRSVPGASLHLQQSISFTEQPHTLPMMSHNCLFFLFIPKDLV